MVAPSRRRSETPAAGNHHRAGATRGTSGLALPDCVGEFDAKTSLFLHSDAGLGEQLRFASCLPEVTARLKRCVLACDPRLVDLFQRSFPFAEVHLHPVSELNCDAAARCDCRSTLANVFEAVRRESNGEPRFRRYLAADANAVRRWRARLAEIGNGLTVGISWRGSKDIAESGRRPSTLEQWRPVLETPGVRFVNLQHDARPQELRAIRELTGVTIHHWDDVAPRKHVDDLAAQMATLDLVIAADPTTAHLAAGLGVAVWTLSLRHAEESDLPAAGTMKTYRRSETANRQAIFTDLADDLRAVIGGPSS